MKNRKHFLLSLFFLKLFLLTSGANTYAFTPQATLDLDSREGDFFKADQNRKAVFFEENIVETFLQKSSEKGKDPIPNYSKQLCDQDLANSYSENLLFQKYQPNQRSILKIQIFPFHTFW